MLFSRCDSRVTISQQLAVLVAHFRNARQHADRSRDRGQRIANLVRNRSRQPAHGGEAVLHAHFPLQTPDLSQIVQRVDKSQHPAFRHCQAATRTRNVLRKLVGALRSESPRAAAAIPCWAAGPEINLFRGAHQLRLGTLQQLLRGGVHQRNVAVKPGGDQSSADGLDDVLVQGLQIFQRSAGVLELHST